jgi:hypothetical protein
MANTHGSWRLGLAVVALAAAIVPAGRPPSGWGSTISCPGTSAIVGRVVDSQSLERRGHVHPHRREDGGGPGPQGTRGQSGDVRSP